MSISAADAAAAVRAGADDLAALNHGGSIAAFDAMRQRYQTASGGGPPNAPPTLALRVHERWDHHSMAKRQAPDPDGDHPKIIDGLTFGTFDGDEMKRLSHMRVRARDLFASSDRQPTPNGVLDVRMGISSRKDTCATCGGNLNDCVGHFGHIELCMPVFHYGFFKKTLKILQAICKSCSRVLLTPEEHARFLKQMRTPYLTILEKKVLLTRVIDRCKKRSKCAFCGAFNGTVKKVAMMKVMHEKWCKKNGAAAAEFRTQLDGAVAENPKLEEFVREDSDWKFFKVQDYITPLMALTLLERMTDDDVEVLDMGPDQGRPERLLLTDILVPPICIRPSIAMATASQEDDITVQLSNIVHANNCLEDAMQKGAKLADVMAMWDHLQTQCATVITSDLPLQTTGNSKMRGKKKKQIRGFCQRLKGKQGRFRQNLSGKRVDFSSRTVISPDPNLRIDQVAVPIEVAKILTYPELVTKVNLAAMRKVVTNGPKVHPGASFVIKGNGTKFDLKWTSDLAGLARSLRPGDVIERHLRDEDIVLFNRQPSLHKLSIMSHRVKVRPWRTFRFNECVCSPYNADFDGDEMNMHVPQTEEARAEADILMGVKSNLVTPGNGSIVIAALQDFISAAYLLSRRDVFLTRAQFCQICASFSDAKERIVLPPPAIFKPTELWTGKQAMSVMLNPLRLAGTSGGTINVEAKTRSFLKATPPPFVMCPNDGYLVISGSEIMCGVLDKSNLGSANSSIFYVLLRDVGSDEAAAKMRRLAKFCARFLCNRGFSIGIEDVRPPAALTQAKSELIQSGYDECSGFIRQFEDATMERQPGFTLEETLEAKIKGRLSKLREEAGEVCLSHLPAMNTPMVMALCGSKGSKINVSQMTACVGQQIIAGSRVPDGFIDRALPHFPKGDRAPGAKGFVSNSFYTGLTPTEFFFHTMAGREGLVDTAVKTADTGYMQRRLMKALEDLAAQYDGTVQSSLGNVVQLAYGGDRLDPHTMEATGLPISFEREFSNVRTQVPRGEGDVVLLPYQIGEMLEAAADEGGPLADIAHTMYFKHIERFVEEHFIEETLNTRLFCGLEPFRTQADAVPETEVAFAGGMGVAADICNRLFAITAAQMRAFLASCRDRYRRSVVEPGSAVGALCAQSLGEPTTQMTLRTFHFAGVASMNVTLGVPRIQEIINATRTVSTPIAVVPLLEDSTEIAARLVKGTVEKTTLGDVSKSISAKYTAQQIYFEIKLDLELIQKLQLGITAVNVSPKIKAVKKLKLKQAEVFPTNEETIIVIPAPPAPAKKGGRRKKVDADFDGRPDYLQTIRRIKAMLPDVVVSGLPRVRRAVIEKGYDLRDADGKMIHSDGYIIKVEGNGLDFVSGAKGVNGTMTESNDIMEVFDTLGVEAARSTIINEINHTMGHHGMELDRRHVELLSDLMTFNGDIHGINRHGIAKMKDSVLHLASFEKTTDHLFNAATHSRHDQVKGVSECIIMGKPIPLGTGVMRLLHRQTTTMPELRGDDDGSVRARMADHLDHTTPRDGWHSTLVRRPLFGAPSALREPISVAHIPATPPVLNYDGA